MVVLKISIYGAIVKFIIIIILKIAHKRAEIYRKIINIPITK